VDAAIGPGSYYKDNAIRSEAIDGKIPNGRMAQEPRPYDKDHSTSDFRDYNPEAYQEWLDSKKGFTFAKEAEDDVVKMDDRE